jgi:hypothetical protein
MRVMRFVPVVAGFAAMLAVPLLSAQGVGTGSAETAQTKLPFTATWTQTSVQTLTDGTTITRQATTKYARDASGRIYWETQHQLPSGQDGQQHEVIFYSVQDPAAHTNLNWNSNTKEAILTHLSTSAATAPRTLSAIQTTPSREDTQQAAKPDPNVQREDLGTKNIAGINAKGVRTTHVFPAGQIGNSQPITIVSEMWRSTEYGLILMSSYEDPRSGKSTREVTDFQPGDPDPSLFQAPQGYSVREVTPHAVAVAPVQ